MKKILQALDTASTKPVEGSNDMKKFVSIVTESANPHKVSLPVQMAMNHYQEVKVEKPLTIKEVKKASLSSNLYQYLEVAEKQVAEQHAEKKTLISEQARTIAQRVMELNKTTLKSYKAKAEDQVEELKPHADSGEYKDIAKNAITRREKGIKTAEKKIADPEYGNQNESQDPAEYDQEGKMAQQDLSTAEQAAEELRSILSSNENLPEWVQAKITKAVDYLDTARDYMKSVDESRDRWDSNMPGHERYAGMGRGEREDDEYHVPDPVDNRIAYKVIATVTTPDGNEEKKGVSVKTVSGPKHAETVAIKHLEGAGFQVKAINSVHDLGPV